MHFIDSLNETRFTLNGAEYLKNYVSAVRGGKVEIFNCYETKDILVPLSRPAEISVNGSVYEDALQLQAVLQDVLFSRSTLTGGSTIGQNNKGRIIALRTIYDISVEHAAEKANQLNIQVLEDECPVVLTGIKPNGRSSQKYYYLFLGGKGSWGSNGSPIQPAHLILLTSERVTASLLYLQENVLINNLGGIREHEFLRIANASTWDFTDPDVDNYFTYEDDGLSSFKIFTGPAGLYGGKEKELLEEHFLLVTDSTVQAGTPAQSLQEVLEAGSTAGVQGPFSVTVRNGKSGGTIRMENGEFYAGNSNGFTFSTGRDFNVSNGGNITFGCSNIATVSGGQGFRLEGSSGGSIVTDAVTGVTISGHAGGINLLGNTLGVTIDGQGGPVNIDAGNGINLISGKGISCAGEINLPGSGHTQPMVFGADKSTDPLLFRDADGRAIRVANGVLKIGGSAFDTNTNIAGALTAGGPVSAYEIKADLFRSNDGLEKDMRLEATGDITIGSSADKVLKVFRDLNIFGKGGYSFSVSASGLSFNGKKLIANGVPFNSKLELVTEAGLSLTGKESISLFSGGEGVKLYNAPAHYSDDYSAMYKDRSLVDKAYVDSKSAGTISISGELVDDRDKANLTIATPTLEQVLSAGNASENVIQIKNVQLHDEIDSDYKVVRVSGGKLFLPGSLKGIPIENSLQFSADLQNFVFPSTGGEIATKEWVSESAKPASSASPTTAGVLKLYTQTGSQTDGTIDQLTVTSQLAQKANVASPIFTGTVTIPTGGLTLAGGATNTYLRGDGSASNFVTQVRVATVSTGTTSSSTITPGTGLDSAVWQLQNQLKNLSAYEAVTANYTATPSSSVIACNGNLTLTLPVTGIGAGKRYTVKNIAAGTVTVVASGGATIDGAVSRVLSAQWSCAKFVFDGSNYLIISQF